MSPRSLSRWSGLGWLAGVASEAGRLSVVADDASSRIGSSPESVVGAESGGVCSLLPAAVAASRASDSGASYTAVPYADTSLSDWVISLQSYLKATTASAPAATAMSIILVTASCRDRVSMVA